MVLIFGFGSGQPRDLGEVAPTTCPNCHNEVYLHHVRSQKEFSLFFVPVVPYGSNEYLLCPICRHGLQLRSDQVALVNQMSTETAALRRGTFPGDYRAAVDRFWRQLGYEMLGGRIAAPAHQPASGVPSDPETLATPVDALSARLEALGRLHAEGVLTDEEFTAAKRGLLET
jgi:hypothetical protein